MLPSGLSARGWQSPAADPRARSTRSLIICVVISVVVQLSFPCFGQCPGPPLDDMMQPDIPSKPITLGDMIHRGLFAIAREVFSQSSVSQIHGEDLGVPKPGVQVDLFTPGDAGVTVRYRW